MEIRILGPLEVCDGDRKLELGGGKQRALLANLAIHRGEPLSADRLIDDLWGERPPATAAKTLQALISRLRKALGRDAIVTRGGGYLLADGLSTDVGRLEDLVGGRPTTEAIYDALQLFRGRPLEEFAFDDFAQTEIARLEELRLATLEQRIDADLAAGRHARLIPELDALVRQHPLRERLRAQLMLALYRSGRQAEALETFQEARRTLTEDLGLEPSTELRELQRAILEQDASLKAEGEDVPAEPGEPAPAAAPAPARVAPAPRRSRKTVTVLSCDVLTTTAALDPESVRRVRARAFEALVPILEQHEATVERSLGGSVTAVFGIPAVHEDDALRAARAAVEMRETLGRSQEPLAAGGEPTLALRAGISTGEVITGGGDGSDPSVTGPPIESAAHLHHVARPGELLLDERTVTALRDLVHVDRLEDRIVLVDVASRSDGYPRRIQSPMVGRERERRRLHDAFAQAVGDRSSQLFTILGAPGVGKSRLVGEFLRDVASSALVARGRCLPYGDGITYWPVVEAVRDGLRLDDAATVDEPLLKVRAALAGEDEAELVAGRVGEVLGLSDQVSSVEDTLWAVRAFFEALARRRPLVLVFDDIHWGEPTFLDLVDHISEWTRDAPLLLVCVARPELLDARPYWGGGKVNSTTILLEPLSFDESSELVQNLSRSTNLDRSAREEIVEAAGGNPLFAEEMLALVLEQPESTPLEVPPTIQALLAARLDRLGEPERSAIEAAAVEGRVFHESSVAELVGAPPSEIQRHLLTLVRKELVRPDRAVFADERAYRFRHLLIRDAAYDAIPKEARARLHEAHAGWLERRASERILEFEEILGYHLEQAVQYRGELGLADDATRELGRAAAARLGAAGKRAFVRRDAQAAVTLLSRAVALLPPDDISRVELVPNVRVVQGLSGDLSWADAVLTDAVETAAVAGDRRLQAHALVQRGFLRLFTNPEVSAEELTEIARGAVSTFEGYRDGLGLARAWRLMAQAHYLDRHAGLSVDASERALEHARRSGDLLERREVVEWLCVGLMLGPTPASSAAARCEQLLDDVREDPILEPTIISVLGNLNAMLGRVDEWERLLARFKAAVNQVGETAWLFAVNFGFVALADDPVAAERELRPGYDALRRFGEKSHFSSISALLARTIYAQGRYDEAYRLTRESEEAARPNDIHSHILWRGTRAKVLAQRGELDTGEALARAAVAFAEASDFLDSHADTLMDLAEVLRLASRVEEARAAVAKALPLYERKENLISAGRARATWATLAAASP